MLCVCMYEQQCERECGRVCRCRASLSHRALSSLSFLRGTMRRIRAGIRWPGLRAPQGPQHSLQWGRFRLSFLPTAHPTTSVECGALWALANEKGERTRETTPGGRLHESSEAFQFGLPVGVVMLKLATCSAVCMSWSECRHVSPPCPPIPATAQERRIRAEHYTAASILGGGDFTCLTHRTECRVFRRHGRWRVLSTRGSQVGP